ncbi:MAG TPA: type 4a pilus biogenesis protein PilO [Candidatus Paceibacterota bacterium]|nr:type 4a pilus biogenesis protein PilO [Candidatus Paceibacterota bacterium]
MRLLFPIILVAAAIGLFVVYTNPTYQATKALSTQAAAYDDALTKSQELRSVRDQLLAKRNTFSTDDVQKLTEILPDNVDNIRLIIDINNIASRHGLSLSGVDIGDIAGSGNALAAGNTTGPVGSVDVSFGVTTSYDNMLSFLTDLEHSLRLVDVQKLAFTAGQGDSATYTFTIRTYWLQ